MKTVIEMAREAGFVLIDSIHEDCAERFAALVAAAENEACAKHAEDFLTKGRSPLGRAVGDAIRSRRNT